MKRITVILLCALLLAGCGAEPDADSRGYTFTDDLGRKVSMDNPPQRVACLLGSFADVWTISGGTVIAAPDDAWDDFDLALEDATMLGSTKELSLELLLAAEPDFILASANTQQHLQWRDILESTGIPVAYFNVSGFDDYLRMLEICCDINGRRDLYEQNGTAIEHRIQACIDRCHQRIDDAGQAPTALFLRASATSIRAKNSTGNVTGELLKALGCVNIADSDESLLENLSMEHILTADPDFIFFVQSGDDDAGTQAHIQQFLRDNPAWASLTAVREGRVYELDKRLFNLKPNALWADAYEQMEEILWNE